ncbi:hypothetical protein ACOACO_14725 [Nocardioides sp. CPCC 205120]|uniref:hypothetical protein n=1 Tax=Nocardioides sp. CPCC 205120 TaxID=3406462 RepID=UPI003B51076F
MNYPRYDFSGHRVTVAGGTAGTGLAVAHAFADTGAEVTVTGAQHLTGFYDADLTRFRYRQLALDHPEAIAEFAARSERTDVLVLAAAPELPRHLGAADLEFVVEASRLGLVGPLQLVRRLRDALAASAAQGGGAVVCTRATTGWWALQPPGDAVDAADVERVAEAADAALVAAVGALAASVRRHGVRVNACLTSPRVEQGYHVQIGRRAPHTSGTLLTRPRRVRGSLGESTRAAVVDTVQFLASAGAAGITGQTLRVG